MPDTTHDVSLDPNHTCLNEKIAAQPVPCPIDPDGSGML